ncbi:MAG: CTP synthase [Clostridia bacterium]|nr:CTP synthase [Clostridia bacterium]
MSVKYIFVTGGVVSGLGKGITAASLGRLLKARGYKVTIQKFDPYLNVDPGTMSPYQHGEVFVTDDGAETDLDLGHYERFIDENLNKYSNITSGKIYWSVLNKERRGDYLGGTVQVIPHITNEIKSNIYRVVKEADNNTEILITEIGGTVGDMESEAFMDSIRQIASEVGRENVLYVHVTLVPYLSKSGEQKSKPTQHSVKELLARGIQPDILVCRSEIPLEKELKDKLALFCNVKSEAVIENMDVSVLYEVPLMLEEQHMADTVLKRLGLENRKPDLDSLKELIEKIKNISTKTKIALVGKYVKMFDAYLSVVEAMKHAGYSNDAEVEIKWVNSEELTEENVAKELGDVNGIIVPGGFGERGIEGKVVACKYARENKIPYFGICLGMQVATIEYARNVAGLKGANSTEINPETAYPVIDLIPDQYNVSDKGGTMRLGKYPCVINEDSKAFAAYGTKEISERHRHRYEFSNDYKNILTEKGLILSGTSPDKNLVEIVEIKDHPWFVGVQFHPEYKSRPERPHPLFKDFIKATLEYSK